MLVEVTVLVGGHMPWRWGCKGNTTVGRRVGASLEHNLSLSMYFIPWRQNKAYIWSTSLKVTKWKEGYNVHENKL
jgi:hypothetical protein